jgi:molybdopterin converting factor subunit 1
MIHVTIQYFGPAADACGAERGECTLPDGATLGDLMARLHAQHLPLARAGSTVRYAVNLAYAAPQRVLRDGDEVAVIPPVSGG